MNYKNINSILFVCMGNICRSPTAEAVFREKAKQAGLQLKIDSAGTIGAHAREKPDPRSVKVGEEHGYSFAGLKARKVVAADFEHFDIVLAMDLANLRDLIALAPDHLAYKAKLFLEFAPESSEEEVPDPYYGGANGFKYVLSLAEQASDGLLEKIKGMS